MKKALYLITIASIVFGSVAVAFDFHEDLKSHTDCPLCCHNANALADTAHFFQAISLAPFYILKSINNEDHFIIRHTGFPAYYPNAPPLG